MNLIFSMNEFNRVDKIGQSKAVRIIQQLFPRYDIMQHYDCSRTDIDLTGYTGDRCVTYTIECKDRKYTTEYLVEKGALIEIDKFNALKENRVKEKFNKAIYFNTTIDGYVIYDLTNTDSSELEVRNITRPIYTIQPEKGYRSTPCYLIPNNKIVKVESNVKQNS